MMPRQEILSSGIPVPVLGQGTWNMGDRKERREDELRALRLGLDLGMTLIDTAEMYGRGRSEELVGEAIRGRRDEVFLVTKVIPENASRESVPRSCEKSLRRLGTDRIDLYLLHWRGRIPLAETVGAFERLVDAGLVRHWGVSNLDAADLDELVRLPAGAKCAVNQVYYNLFRRGIERRLLPVSRKRGIVTMAYSPFEQGRLRQEGVLARVAGRRGITVHQTMLAWTIRANGVIAIPKSGNPEHVRQNAAAAQVRLDDEDLRELDIAYPAPGVDVPLETT
jgi:diketogulonate reductase-like aldo/keto reductase